MYYQSYYSQSQQQPQQPQQPQPPPPPPPPPIPQSLPPQHPHPHHHQQQPPPYHNNRDPHHVYRSAYSSFYRSGVAQNRSSHNLNYSREFDPHATPPHGYNSVPTGAYPFYDATNQQRWRQNATSTRVHHQYRRTPAFHFHDKSTYYYMSDPIITHDNRITIQLTKVHIGHNGDQQRVFVEQEFSDENELKKFVKNLRQNFEKTFNNRATGVHSSDENIDEHHNNNNNKKSSVIVVEEPDEEPKVYDQKAYNDNIESKQSKNGDSPIANSPKLDKREQYQRSPLESSCSTIRTSRRRRNRMRYQREKFVDEPNIEPKEQPPEKMPSYSRQYEPPPRFQQRPPPKEKDFRLRNDFSVPPNLNSHWRYSGYSHSLNSRSRSYIPPMNENLPPPTPSRFQYNKDPFFRPIHPPTPPRFAQSKNPHKSQPSPRFHAPPPHRRNQPTTIAEHFIFMNNEQHQPRVHRTRSDCRRQGPLQTRNKTYQYLDYGTNSNQRQFTPLAQSSAPMFYPQRRFFRNTQKHSCLFNSYRPNSKRF